MKGISGLITRLKLMNNSLKKSNLIPRLKHDRFYTFWGSF